MFLKKLILIVLISIQPISVWAESSKKPKEISATPMEAIQLAGSLVDRGDFRHAQQILTKMPKIDNVAIETERWFLLGQIAQKQGDYETAINIYRDLLDNQPDLARIRFELAKCYMETGRWYRADYHLRLAMAGKDLPDNVKQMMSYYRYLVRQNKRWNVWFNFGAAPDSNINNGNGGEECVYGIFCRKLKEPESVMGVNATLGGNYEFVLSDNWRWKSDANIYSNSYNNHEYDDLYLSSSTGPRYIWSRGDVWLAGIMSRRWYGGERYNWSYGAKLDTNYDFTRKLSGGLDLRVTDNNYDFYGDFLNGQTYSTNLNFTYSWTSYLYTVLRTGISREDAVKKMYSYWQPSVGFGVGAELPYGFHIYVEPYFYWMKYDDKQWVVKDDGFQKITEEDFVQRYSVSLSNNKFDIWGFVPTITASYTKRKSNIWQREYEKTTLEFTMQQRF